jgi:DNA-binding GntR family transcriptional regulator
MLRINPPPTNSGQRPIVEALEEKNAERAVLEMEEHLTSAFEQLDTNKVISPDYFSL